MTALAIIGALVLLAAALFLTFVAAQCFFGELMWSSRPGPFTFAIGAAATILWALFFWLQPFRISLEFAP